MPNNRQLCIHGHFYQPPREDPWLGRILIEQSAAPMRHWNERIVAESYGPMGWAHRIGDDGRIIEIINCYEWISFNVGPTLLHWLERRAPREYARILEADALSLARLGHGNAIAQVYHHVIMPLASSLDRKLEVAWAIADFEARFKRAPEGMWLAECAVDGNTLEELALEGISFVILSPYQVKAVAYGNEEYLPVQHGGFDIAKPYRIELPSGRSIAAFFYDGPVSQAIAFEGLLRNGEQFWQRVNGASSGGLLTLATDGETYGHHFPFGEMALAYVLAQARNNRDGMALTNPAAYLASHAPEGRVLLHEPSSWSCAHGVERWRNDCGCKDGGHPDWNQRWRPILRDALATVKTALDEHFAVTGRECFNDAEAALCDYGRVLADPDGAESFAARHIKNVSRANTAWQLLAMQEQALAAFASCAWFFDDISRIEPVNGMTFMVRAMELAVKSGGPDMVDVFSEKLSLAVSNKPEEGSGADILKNRVLPRRQDTASLALMALLLLDMQEGLPTRGCSTDVVWPGFSIQVAVERADAARRVYSGTLRIGTALERGGESVAWEWKAPSFVCAPESLKGSNPFMHELHSSVTVMEQGGVPVTRTLAELPRHVRDYIALSTIFSRIDTATPERLAVARHILSLMEPWEEGQTSMPYAWNWTTFAPYLLVACVIDNDIPEKKREQTLAFVDTLEIPYSMRESGWKMTETIMLANLEDASPDWKSLTEWLHKAARVFPERNLWKLRNVFWQRRTGDATEDGMRDALGFRD